MVWTRQLIDNPLHPLHWSRFPRVPEPREMCANVMLRWFLCRKV